MRERESHIKTITINGLINEVNPRLRQSIQRRHRRISHQTLRGNILPANKATAKVIIIQAVPSAAATHITAVATSSGPADRHALQLQGISCATIAPPIVGPISAGARSSLCSRLKASRSSRSLTSNCFNVGGFLSSSTVITPAYGIFETVRDGIPHHGQAPFFDRFAQSRGLPFPPKWDAARQDHQRERATICK